MSLIMQGSIKHENTKTKDYISILKQLTHRNERRLEGAVSNYLHDQSIQ
jgi:hypothetical protein